MSGSWDRKTIRWDLDTGAIIREFTFFNSHITSIKFRPSGTPEETYHSPTAVEDVAFVLSFDGKGTVVDHRDPAGIVKTVSTQAGVPPWGLSASWSPDGKRVYIGRRNGSVDEWDFAEGKIIQNFKLPRDSGAITSVLCMPNGRHVLCASFDNIRSWDLHYTPPDTTMTGVTDASSSTGGGGGDKHVHDFDLSHPIVPFSIVAGHHGGCISSLALDWSGRYLVSVSGNRGWDGISNNQCLLYNVSAA
ncbi:UNVERIFIED_CONTAM: Transcription factor spt8 [Siphonaria sp. JEL0065]|nr:Transcription factor spt8 [Siphonaria sp. JEL0065]